MTNWQWQVIIALVRYVLRKDNVDLNSMYEPELIDEDLNILTEAVIRSNND